VEAHLSSHIDSMAGWRISETAMPCQADFLNFMFAFDKLLPSTSEWPTAGEAEAGSAGEQPAEE
jgi:hypothetical protein